MLVILKLVPHTIIHDCFARKPFEQTVCEYVWISLLSSNLSLKKKSHLRVVSTPGCYNMEANTGGGWFDLSIFPLLITSFPLSSWEWVYELRTSQRFALTSSKTSYVLTQWLCCSGSYNAGRQIQTWHTVYATVLNASSFMVQAVTVLDTHKLGSVFQWKGI